MHKDTTFELKFRLAALVNQRLAFHLVLGLGGINILAAEEDVVEEVDMVLTMIISSLGTRRMLLDCV